MQARMEARTHAGLVPMQVMTGTSLVWYATLRCMHVMTATHLLLGGCCSSVSTRFVWGGGGALDGAACQLLCCHSRAG